MAVMFHSRTGTLVTLKNGNRTAQRNLPSQEFNNGMVMSAEPLRDNQLFEVRLDEKVNSWSGSIEIGVTTRDPNALDFPASATDLRENCWIMSGSSILRDGRSIIEEYGYDLDKLVEGDRVGVMRTSHGDLVFFVNDVNQGIAASNIPQTVYAVVDMYGKCSQVTIVETFSESQSISSDISNPNLCAAELNGMANNISTNADKLRFHDRCGSLVKLSNNKRAAERRRPLDEFNNGVVMTHRPLRDNELFEIRIDRLVDKWSGSIEVGITTHNPATLEFPATMTNMRSGTVMMSGCGILTNGKGTRREYGEYNLDELVEGDKIGLMRKSNGTLHYYINSMDQGVAAVQVPQVVFGVVDLYGMTVKVTIVGNDDSSDQETSFRQNNTTHNNNNPLDGIEGASGGHDDKLDEEIDRLLFHPRCGSHVTVIFNGRTAYRPNAVDDFNNAVVLTNRPLHTNELFEVVLNKIVYKWAGSIEIGVTTHSPLELDFPSTMTNIRSGTWMMTGNGIMHNGTTVIYEYGQSLDELKIGDRVGVIRKDNGTLHFYVNGIDQGPAASNVPEKVYGVVDLFGQAAQATLIDHLGVTAIRPEDLEFPNTMTDIDYDTWMLSGSAVMQDGSTIRNGYKCDLDSLSVNSRIGMSRHADGTLHYYINGEDQGVSCTDIPPKTSHHFSQCCGKNITLRNNNLTASRIRSFNHGLLFSSTPLEPDELFEIRIDQVGKQWSGSLQIGLTTLVISDAYSISLLPPHAMELNLDVDTWLLTGNQVRKDGVVLKENFGPSLDRLSVGDHVGVKYCSDGTMHAYINGEDLGVAASQIPKKVFAVVDLYGPVEAVTVTSKCCTSSLYSEENEREVHFSNDSHDSLENDIEMTNKENNIQEFHENHGRNIQLTNRNLTARRTASYNQGVLVSQKPLSRGQLFQVRIECLNSRWTSSLLIGVTGQSPEKMYFPITALGLKKSSWIVCNDCVFQNGVKIKGRYGPNLDSVKVHHVVGVLVDNENRLHLYINGIDQGVAAKDIPSRCFAILDLYGQCEEVSITSGEELVPTQELLHKEKADFDNGKKEKLRTFGKGTLITDCEYKNACIRMKALLGVPDGYFSAEHFICFCENCYKIRGGGEAYVKKGEPPKESTLPLGWCKFSLRFPAKVETIGTGDKWHIAFHGSELGKVRKTLDQGELLLPGETGLGTNLRNIAHKNKSTEGNGNGSQISFSPSIFYAGHVTFCPRHELIDPKTKKSLQVQVAFQILVRPGSYKIGPQRIGAREAIDTRFNNSEIEWFTKERGAIVLHSLLVRVEGL